MGSVPGLEFEVNVHNGIGPLHRLYRQGYGCPEAGRCVFYHINVWWFVTSMLRTSRVHATPLSSWLKFDMAFCQSLRCFFHLGSRRAKIFQETENNWKTMDSRKFREVQGKWEGLELRGRLC